MVQTTNSGAKSAEAIAAQEAVKKRAARQAMKRELAPEVFPEVECVVLPMGDGKISMGEHIGGLGTAHYEEGEKFTVQLPIALDLYERGYVNFEGARAAMVDRKAARQGDEAAEAKAKAEQDKLLQSAGLA